MSDREKKPPKKVLEKEKYPTLTHPYTGAIPRTRHPDAPSTSRQQDSASTSRQQDSASTSRQQDAASTSKQPDAPSTSRHPDAPSTSRQQDAPSTSRHPDAPSTSRQQDAPSTSRQPDAPSTSRQPDAPSTSRHPDAPSTSRQPDAPSTSRQPDAPSTSKQAGPASTDYAVFPSTSRANDPDADQSSKGTQTDEDFMTILKTIIAELASPSPPPERKWRAHMAFVMSQKNMSSCRNRAFFSTLIEASLAEDRFSNMKLELVGWEDQKVDWTQFSHIIFSQGLDYVDHFEDFEEFLDKLPEKAKQRVVNGVPAIKWNMHKKYLIELQRNGIRLPPSYFVFENDKPRYEDMVSRVLEESPRFHESNGFVLKCMVDSNAQTMGRYSFEDVEDGIDEYLEDNDYGFIFQQFLPFARIEGEWSIIYFNGVVSHMVLKVGKGGTERMEYFHTGKAIFVGRNRWPDDIIQFSQHVLDVLKFKLTYARVDIVRNNILQPTLMELDIFQPNLFIHQREHAVSFLCALLGIEE